MKRIQEILVSRPWLSTLVILVVIERGLQLFYPSILYFNPLIYCIGIFQSILFFYWLNLLHLRFSPAYQKGIALILGFLITFGLLTNIFLFTLLNEFLSVYTVQYISRDPMYVWDTVRDYLINWKLILFFSFWTFFSWLWWPQTSVNGFLFKKRHWVGLFLLPLLYFVVLNETTRFAKQYQMTLDTHTIYAFGDTYYITKPSPLQNKEKPSIRPNVLSETPNIILIINESWGKYLGLSFYKNAPPNAMPRLAQWIERESSHFFVFSQALSNSTATDVSIPSLLTGLNPYRRVTDYNYAPLIWDWAKAQGYDTFFTTVQSFGDHPGYYLSPGIDHFITARDFSKAAMVNDTGIDDILVTQKVVEDLNSINTPFFYVFNTNALHGPFLQKSKYLKDKPSFKHPYNNALYIIDSAIDMIYRSLKESGKLENTIFIFTGDHGEAMYDLHSMGRLYSFYEEYIGIPFLIRVPEKWQSKYPKKLAFLRENQDKLISNVDIVPTVIDMLGLSEVNQDLIKTIDLDGVSLAQSYPKNRLVFSLNTNDFRHWNHEGFAISWDKERYLFNDFEGDGFFDLNKDAYQAKSTWGSLSKTKKDEIKSIIKNHYHINRIYTSKVKGIVVNLTN